MASTIDTEITSRPIVLQEQSAFLRLPGELRNKIYTYAFAKPDPWEPEILYPVPKDQNNSKTMLIRYTRWKNNRWYEINQLKYVCRQLYLETRYFGLKEQDFFVAPPHFVGSDEGGRLFFGEVRAGEKLVFHTCYRKGDMDIDGQ
jgi:hypothetical protein